MNWVYSPGGITEWPSGKDAWYEKPLLEAQSDFGDQQGVRVMSISLILEQELPEAQKP